MIRKKDLHAIAKRIPLFNFRAPGATQVLLESSAAYKLQKSKEIMADLEITPKGSKRTELFDQLHVMLALTEIEENNGKIVSS